MENLDYDGIINSIKASEELLYKEIADNCATELLIATKDITDNIAKSTRNLDSVVAKIEESEKVFEEAIQSANDLQILTETSIGKIKDINENIQGLNVCFDEKKLKIKGLLDKSITDINDSEESIKGTFNNFEETLSNELSKVENTYKEITELEKRTEEKMAFINNNIIELDSSISKNADALNDSINGFDDGIKNQIDKLESFEQKIIEEFELIKVKTEESTDNLQTSIIRYIDLLEATQISINDFIQEISNKINQIQEVQIEEERLTKEEHKKNNIRFWAFCAMFVVIMSIQIVLIVLN